MRAYRRTIELFPGTRWAAVAKERIEQLKPDARGDRPTALAYLRNEYERFESACVVVALVLGTLSSAGQSAKPQAAEPVSNTALAERMVQILWEADAPPPDVSGVLGSLFGADTTDLAARILNVKDSAAAQQPGRADGTARSDGRGRASSACGSVSAQDGKTPRAAKEFADALVERLSSRLSESRQEAVAMRRNRVQQSSSIELEKKVAETWKQDARQAGRSCSSSPGAPTCTVASLQSSLGKLEDERQRLELDLAGMEARLEAVQEQLKAAGDKAKEQLAADPVVGELEKAVAAREKLAKLIQIRVEEGLAPPAEVAKAESDLIEAKVQLLDRKTAASRAGATRSRRWPARCRTSASTSGTERRGWRW